MSHKYCSVRHAALILFLTSGVVNLWNLRYLSDAESTFIETKGEEVMGNSGKKDKGSKEQKKKPKLNIKEKRKLKNEKKNQ